MARNKPIKITILGDAKKATAAIRQTSQALTVLGKAGKGLAKVAAPLASFAALIGPATSGVLALAKGVTALGKTAAGLAPLIAFAPAAAGAYGLLRLTLTKVGAALGETLKPLGEAFGRAGDAAGRLATRGVAPLAAAFARLNLPTISKDMDRIALSTNRAVIGFGRWVNSAAGQKLVRDTTNGTASAFERAEPAITRAAIALGNLANRAGVSDRLAALGGVIAGLVDRFTRWADATTSADIDRALRTAADATSFLRDKLLAIRDAITWLSDNQAKIKAFSNALAALGLALSVYTLNPVGIAVAAFTLLANNWDETKKAFAGASSFWQKTWAGAAKSPALAAFRANALGSFSRITDGAKSFGTSVAPALSQVGGALGRFGTALLPALSRFGEQFSRVIGPALSDIGVIIRDQVAPAFSSFLVAVTPIAKFLLGVFGSAVIGALKGVVNVLKGALVIISGAFNLISGLLTGDWSRAWEGIKAIVAGAFTAILGAVQVFLNVGFLRLFKLGFSVLRGIVTGGWAAIRGAFTGALGSIRGALNTVDAALARLSGAAGRHVAAIGSRISAALSGLRAKVTGAFSGAGNWLKDAGRRIIGGLVGSVEDGFDSVKRKFNQLTNLIPSWKGPAARDRDLLKRPADLIMGGFANRLQLRFKDVRSSLAKFTASLAKSASSASVPKTTSRALQEINRQVAGLKASAEKQRAVLADLIQQRRNYAAQLTQSLRGGITSISLDGLGTDPRLSRSTLVTGLQQRLAAIRTFRRQLASLRRRGLAADIIRQIADSGLETGAAYLSSLAGASPALIAQINRLNGSIARGAAGIGGTAADALFGARIRDQQAKVAQATVIRIDSSGSRLDDLIVELLRKAIRAQGGNVQLVLGR